MPTVKISSKLDEKAWNDLKEIANETHRSISVLLTEAVREYVQRRRVRPSVLRRLEMSMDENEQLGKLLATPPLMSLERRPGLEGFRQECFAGKSGKKTRPSASGRQRLRQSET